MATIIFLFVINVLVSVYGVFRLCRDSGSARARDLGVAFGCFWWTIIAVIWSLFAILVHLHH